MPDPKPDAEQALRKLGQRVRQGIANTYPVSEKNLAAVKDAVRQQFVQDQEAQRNAPRAPQPSKDQKRKPPGRGPER